MKKFLNITLKVFAITSFSFLFLHIILFMIAFITPKIDIRIANNIFLYDKDDNLFFQGNGYKEWISLKQMSPYVIKAAIASEDKKFYYHDGFDYLRIIKSMYKNIKAGRIVEGASTITQQYARNLFLDFDKNWKRKIEEAWLAFEIEVHYSKDQILEGYLNTINYGNGILGIENASKYYFDKSASNLSLAEASMLVGIPRSPNNYSPLNDELAAKQRQSVILNNMVRNKYISENEKEEALKEPLTYIGKKEKLNLATLMYYQNAVIEEMKELGYAPETLIKTKGIKIHTNLDVNAQTILENSIKDDLKNNQDIQVSSVMVEPSTGKIIALVGVTSCEKVARMS
jgi:membrane peptidoglycan carboxypeptidase